MDGYEMKQVLQDLRTGRTEAVSVPAPVCRDGQVLIRTSRTLISAGTERMLVEFSRASLLAKARSQPEKVKQVLDKIHTDGLVATLEAVFRRLAEPMPLGYCNAGRVVEVGRGVTGLAVGDCVASNGPHAEWVCVPGNLCAKVPAGVSDEQAAFTVAGSIALQGVRLLAPALGERFVVYGLGLIGLLCVQLLRAHGCEVLGVDIDAEALRRAEAYGVRTADARAGAPVTAAAAWTEGRGADGVLIAAAAKTDEIVHNAAQMCRRRGRVVLVGVVGLNLRRSDFYEKELTFQVSCSYGPGRYDESYEQGGQDYPFGFVRWTERRNFQAVLECLRDGRLVVDDLITHRFPLDRAAEAYEKIAAEAGAVGVVLEYVPPADAPPKAEASLEVTVTPESAAAPAAGQAVVGVIGAGSFAKAVLLPALARTPGRIAYVADLDGASARHLAARYGAAKAVTDYRLLLDDAGVDAVLIAVQHHLHARLVCEALAAGKHVFVEKPLAMNAEELSQVIAAAGRTPDRLIMVGFNRRFSPHTAKIKALLARRAEPLAMTMTVNAGALPPEHWVHDPARGGGRIIGEACHFIDLMVHLAGSRVRTVSATMIGPGSPVRDDKVAITVGLDDGSVGVVSYFANGSKTYPKEGLEVFSDGRVLRLDNFRRLKGYGFKGFRTFKTLRQDKGHRAELAAFVSRVADGGEPLIGLADLVNVTRATFAAVESAASEKTVVLS